MVDLTHTEDTKILCKAMHRGGGDFLQKIEEVLGLGGMHATLGGMVCFEDDSCAQPFVPWQMTNAGF